MGTSPATVIRGGYPMTGTRSMTSLGGSLQAPASYGQVMRPGSPSPVVVRRAAPSPTLDRQISAGVPRSGGTAFPFPMPPSEPKLLQPAVTYSVRPRELSPAPRVSAVAAAPPAPVVPLRRISVTEVPANASYMRDSNAGRRSRRETFDDGETAAPDYASLAWRLPAQDLVKRVGAHRRRESTMDQEMAATRGCHTSVIMASLTDGSIGAPSEHISNASKRRQSDMDFWHRQHLPFKHFASQHEREQVASQTHWSIDTKACPGWP